MFISDRRVVRDERLIVFEGEVMSEEEAAERGLLDEDKPEEQEDKPKKNGKAK